MKDEDYNKELSEDEGYQVWLDNMKDATETDEPELKKGPLWELI